MARLKYKKIVLIVGAKKYFSFVY